MSENICVSPEEKRTIMGEMPLIGHIGNKEGLRDKVIATWVRLWRQSEYRDIGKAPNIPSNMAQDNETLISHTNAVARITIAAAKAFKQVYGKDINFDYLLAGAMLHDVDKLVTRQRFGNTIEINGEIRNVNHGEYGALIAEQMGLPPEVVNIIACHPGIESNPDPATIEAVIVAHCDWATFQSHRLMSGMALLKLPNKQSP